MRDNRAAPIEISIYMLDQTYLSVNGRIGTKEEADFIIDVVTRLQSLLPERQERDVPIPFKCAG